mmetsp:Transcript_6971/g.22365  ORF Transcript_6971/g.22365 Transcript_6971/m.22365 type:complete len:218 (+) Transcript_6971:372-1025(+)
MQARSSFLTSLPEPSVSKYLKLARTSASCSSVRPPFSLLAICSLTMAIFFSITCWNCDTRAAQSSGVETVKGLLEMLRPLTASCFVASVDACASYSPIRPLIPSRIDSCFSNSSSLEPFCSCFSPLSQPLNASTASANSLLIRSSIILFWASRSACRALARSSSAWSTSSNFFSMAAGGSSGAYAGRLAFTRRAARSSKRASRSSEMASCSVFSPFL